MHYAFDRWIIQEFLMCKWERYVDDGIIHCVSRKQAEYVLDMLKKREIWGEIPRIYSTEKDIMATRWRHRIVTSFPFLLGV